MLTFLWILISFPFLHGLLSMYTVRRREAASFIHADSDRHLAESMWATLLLEVPTMLITLTWILWPWTILQTAGDQSEPTWNMPPATFTLGDTLVKMDLFFSCVCDYFAGKFGLLMGPTSAKWNIPPPSYCHLRSPRAMVAACGEEGRFSLSSISLGDAAVSRRIRVFIFIIS